MSGGLYSCVAGMVVTKDHVRPFGEFEVEGVLDLMLPVFG